MFPGSTQAQIDPWLKSTRYLRETYSQCFSNYSIIDKRSTPKSFDETGITLIQNQANSQKPKKKPIRGKKNLQWKGFIFLTLPCHSSWSKVLSGREDATKLPLDGRKRLLQQKRWAKDPQCGYKTCAAWSRFVWDETEMIEFSAEYNLLQSLLKQ